MGALTGVRILDLSRLLPGPFATRQLAALGAEVIKVEDPNGGDYARWYPPLFGDPPMSGIFQELNVGKKSVALDLKQAEGRQVVELLAAKSDVLVDSFRPGVLDRLGLSPTRLMGEHPRLIYCAISGFGMTGPDARRPGHDIGYLARSGVLGLSGTTETPVVAGAQIADVGAAWVAVSGILAALLERGQTGKGKIIDVSLVEASMGFSVASFGQDAAGEPPVRGEMFLDGSRPCYSVYPAKDGFLAVGALEPKFWDAFLQAIELSELTLQALDQGERGLAAKAKIAARLKERTRDDWMARFSGLETCVEPILDLAEVRADPQLRARDAFEPSGALRSPIRLKDIDADGAPSSSTPAPGLGADTEAVLRALGVPEALISAVLPKA